VTTKTDEIIEEIRRRRDVQAASLGYDLKRIARDLQQQERRSGRNAVARAPKKPSPVRAPFPV